MLQSLFFAATRKLALPCLAVFAQSWALGGSRVLKSENFWEFEFTFSAVADRRLRRVPYRALARWMAEPLRISRVVAWLALEGTSLTSHDIERFWLTVQLTFAWPCPAASVLLCVDVWRWILPCHAIRSALLRGRGKLTVCASRS